MIKLEYLVAKTCISIILSDWNHLYEIYYAFKKEFRYTIVVKNEKNTINHNNNMSILEVQGNL